METERMTRARTAAEAAIARAPFTIGLLLGFAFWLGLQAGIALTVMALWWSPPR